MALVLRDSIDAPLIPSDTPVVAGYGDGKYIWSPSWKDGSNWFDLFPNSVKLVIVVNAAHSGDVLDVENGDATPADVPGWCDRFSRAGRRAPTVYCDRNTWPLVQQAVGARRVDYWIGTLDGTQDVTGAVAVQYIDTGAYDESIITDPSWVGLEDDMLPDERDALMWLREQLDQTLTPTGLAGTLLTGSDVAQQAVMTALAKLQAPTVDVNALATALIPHLPAGTDPAVVAQDVVEKLAAQLGKP